MDADASRARHGQPVDWLEQATDLPHLIARVSELVLSLGHEPEDLVILPRAELDRRELSAYSAGWADVVDEQLPSVRRAYEQRITAAYLQGQEDVRSGRRPRPVRRAEAEPEHGGDGDGGAGGDVIPLPYMQLLHPPAELTRVERRGEQERSLADGPASSADDPDEGRTAHERPDDGTEGDALPSAREISGRRRAPAGRRTVVRRNGRPSVPPLARQPDVTGGRDRSPRAEQRAAPDDAARGRLSDKARALADELEGREGPDRPEGQHEGQHSESARPR
ncbi:hypothetical protein ACIREE_07645 [Streptomyces sp. NPDC102467]|uniref:hypothetical protein n=1 Tax=Streptomyces sp. NPDC102467 TaxID=3366179 RepID=UPI0038304846